MPALPFPQPPLTDGVVTLRALSKGVPLIEIAGWMGHSLGSAKAEIDSWGDPGLSRLTAGIVNNTTANVYSHPTGSWREVAVAEMTKLLLGEP